MATLASFALLARDDCGQQYGVCCNLDSAAAMPCHVMHCAASHRIASSLAHPKQKSHHDAAIFKITHGPSTTAPVSLVNERRIAALSETSQLDLDLDHLSHPLHSHVSLLAAVKQYYLPDNQPYCTPPQFKHTSHPPSQVTSKSKRPVRPSPKTACSKCISEHLGSIDVAPKRLAELKL